VFVQATHFTNILFSPHGMNNTAATQEHQGFEKSMGQHMKYRSNIITGS